MHMCTHGCQMMVTKKAKTTTFRPISLTTCFILAGNPIHWFCPDAGQRPVHVWFDSVQNVYVRTVFIRIEARASIFYKRFLTRRLNESGIYFNPNVNFLLFDRMAGTSTSIYEFDSVVRGQQV